MGKPPSKHLYNTITALHLQIHIVALYLCIVISMYDLRLELALKTINAT